MLPRLQAEEQLAGVRVAALGGGNFAAGDQGRLLDEMERRARGGQRQRAQKASPGELAAMGIGTVSRPAETGVNDG